MIVNDLLDIIDKNRESDEKIQIAHPRDWNEYDTFRLNSEFLKMVAEYSIESMSAIAPGIIRISIDWERHNKCRYFDNGRCVGTPECDVVDCHGSKSACERNGV